MTDMAKTIIEDLPTALYRWYPFRAGARLLYLGCDSAITRMLRGWKNLDVTVETIADNVSLTDMDAEKYSYIVMEASVLEKSKNPTELLCGAKSLLADDGVLLFSMHNRLGIRYFSGDIDPYTQKSLDGVEDYWRVNPEMQVGLTGRCYDAHTVEMALKEAGLQKANRFSVYPGLENPAMLYEENYLPKEKVSSRIFSQYQHPQNVYLEEQFLYDSLVENGLFHQMANAYLYECTKGQASDVLQVTNSLDRGPENSLITVIHADKTVSKEPAYEAGANRIQQLAKNMEYLKKRGIPTIDGHMVDGRYVMPYIDAPTGEQYLKELLVSDVDAYLKELDRFRECISKSAESHDGVLERAFIDMVPLNTFYLDGQYVFFDQEMCMEDLPVDYIMHRVIQIAHNSRPEHESIIRKAELFRRYGMPDGETGDEDERNRYFKLDEEIMGDLRNEKVLGEYYKSVRRDWNVVQRNRDRMSHLAADYKENLEKALAEAKSKKLILFGSGKFARTFLTRYGATIPVHMVLDNNESRWNQLLYPEGYEDGESEFASDAHKQEKGVKIVSPAYLQKLTPGEYDIVICIKNYEAVARQLDDLGIYEYSVYNPDVPYRFEVIDGDAPCKQDTGKPYHIGYTAGAFDLFHIGHVNLLRRAKEKCDYLIVGVMTDEAITDYKKKAPFVPFKERVAMLEACKYVDKVVEIPYRRGNTDEAWSLYHFDVQFCGTDYVGVDFRMQEKEFLEKHGATLEMFPYTESTSSSKLQELIKRNLL
ncbi:MAG: methyltransferase domain-containing protein [Lachnospiraceae bacterium]|jgi:cytidyltransferase-like protein|nr:methyltransferase domain-containing protein [Lachnospiraceae bacterium]